MDAEERLGVLDGFFDHRIRNQLTVLVVLELDDPTVTFEVVEDRVAGGSVVIGLDIIGSVML